MIGFIVWFIRVLWRLNKQDRNSLRAAVARWIDWDEDKTHSKIDVNKVHAGIMNFIPMGAGYVLLVSQSQSNHPWIVDVDITFSSNLSNEQALEILKSIHKKLGPHIV